MGYKTKYLIFLEYFEGRSPKLHLDLRFLGCLGENSGAIFLERGLYDGRHN